MKYSCQSPENFTSFQKREVTFNSLLHSLVCVKIEFYANKKKENKWKFDWKLKHCILSKGK